MSGYNEFRIEAQHDDTVFKVHVKGWFFWKSGFVYTDYFNISYGSKEAAITAIKGYMDRFTYQEKEVKP